MTVTGGGATPPNPGGTGGGGTAAGGVAAWWNKLVSTHRPGIEQRIKGAVTSLQKTKIAMPVDVKIDFIQPFCDTVKKSANAAWQQLPPPVQQAAPYVGVAVSSGFIVFVLQQRRLNNQVGLLFLLDGRTNVHAGLARQALHLHAGRLAGDTHLLCSSPG